MKRDATIAIVVVAAIASAAYGLARIKTPYPPTHSTPFSTTAAPQGPAGPVVLRVNGEAITQSEFEAAFSQLPAELRPQFEAPGGKDAFAEQLIRLKLLEQEGRRLGVEKDTAVAGQLAMDRTNIIARATAEKLVAEPSQQEMQAFYKENAPRFEALDVSHIVVAYQGGSITPRSGGAAPSMADAEKRARKIYQQLKAGADFASMARAVSDDAQTAQQGGLLGMVSRGMLPNDLEAVVWSIPTGQFSEPVPSRLGIHIFRVNARRTTPLPQVSAGIARAVKQKNMFDRVEVLRRSAKVDFDPKFFPGKRSS